MFGNNASGAQDMARRLAERKSILDYVKEKLPNASLVTFQNPSDAAAAFIQGKADAYASNRYAVHAIAMQHPDWTSTNRVGAIIRGMYAE